MNWRKQPTHREEVTAVKRALRKADIPFVSVKHGRGTAWGWLEINVGPQPGPGTMRGELQDQVIRVAQEVTGRHGDYHGEINVLAQ